MKPFHPDPKPLPKEKKTANGIRKISAKKQAEKNAVNTQDKDFYAMIWKERLHKCIVCSTPLYEPLRNYFHHILEKGKRQFKHLRYEKLNIIIVCQDCHDTFHSANRPEEFNRLIHYTFCIFQQKGLLP